jgi:hypothetical protein
MSRPRLVVPLILMSLCVLPALAANPGGNSGVRNAGVGSNGRAIHNKVLDLLDETLFRDSEGETTS